MFSRIILWMRCSCKVLVLLCTHSNTDMSVTHWVFLIRWFISFECHVGWLFLQQTVSPTLYLQLTTTSRAFKLCIQQPLLWKRDSVTFSDSFLYFHPFLKIYITLFHRPTPLLFSSYLLLSKHNISQHMAKPAPSLYLYLSNRISSSSFL